MVIIERKKFENNVTTAFELVNPNEHALLLQFIKTEIAGQARSKLLVRDFTWTWRDVKHILGKIKGFEKLDCYTCRMFSSRQGASQSTASWCSKIEKWSLS